MPRSFPFRTLPLAGLLLLLATVPAHAGPPWIAVEYPANPFTNATRGALLLVRTYHHGEAVSYPLSGTAEGLVQGQRRSMPLNFEPTGTAGLYALRFEKPAEGVWVLVASLGTGEGRIGALIGLDQAGQVASVEVPTHRQDNWVIPEAVTPGAVDAALQAQTAELSRGSGRVGLNLPHRMAILAGLGFVLILPLGLLGRRAGEGSAAFQAVDQDELAP